MRIAGRPALCKLRDRRCAGAGNHDMGCGHAVRHVVEERCEVCINTCLGIDSSDIVDIFGAALLGDRKAPSQCFRHFLQCAWDHFAEDRRTLAAAHNEDFNAFAVRPDRRIPLIADGAERCADGIARQHHVSVACHCDTGCFGE